MSILYKYLNRLEVPNILPLSCFLNPPTLPTHRHIPTLLHPTIMLSGNYMAFYLGENAKQAPNIPEDFINSAICTSVLKDADSTLSSAIQVTVLWVLVRKLHHKLTANNQVLSKFT